MDRLAEHLSLPELSTQREDSRRPTRPVPVNAPNPHRAASSIESEVDGDNGGSWNDDAVEDSGPAAIPASVVSEVTRHSPSARAPGRAKTGSDIISRGLLALEQAELLFNYYTTKHDNYIYSVLEEGSTFTTIRHSSPLLLAAICAVASLHVLSPDIPYERCYEEFVQLSAGHAFLSRNNLDDIRALCIGAFWLPDISWILVTMGMFTESVCSFRRCRNGLYSCSYCHRATASSSISRGNHG